MPQKQMQLHLVLDRDQLQAIAREANAKMVREEWSLLVGFALEVIRLEEALQTGAEYLVLPAARGSGPHAA